MAKTVKEINELWDKVLEMIKAEVSYGTFEGFIQPFHPGNYDRKTKTLYIECSKDLAVRKMNESYLQLVESAVKRASEIDDIKVVARIEEKEEKKPAKKGLPPMEEDMFAEEYYLNPKLTFDNFIVGRSNEFAYNVAMAVAEAPASNYNPFYLYGGSGVGKTHLMHAIGQQILKNFDDLKVLYVTAETFTNEFLGSLNTKSTNKFRKKYRAIDVLLIDDIQFIEGKESTQLEFFNTFEYLYNHNKQIIISSDRPPKNLTELDDRLTQRFGWSITVDIQSPDYETRVAILRSMARNSNVEITPEVDNVISIIAERIKNNVRELEGAWNRINTFCTFLKKPFTPEVAKEILTDIFPDTENAITIDAIKRQVCKYYNVTEKEMVSSRRARSIAYPRQIAMYLSKQLTDSSLPDVGKAFGGRDHTTVLYACNKIKADLEINDDLKKQIEDIRKML